MGNYSDMSDKDLLSSIDHYKRKMNAEWRIDEGADDNVVRRYVETRSIVQEMEAEARKRGIGSYKPK